MKLSPYLNFDGTTEAAMTFYAAALGGTLGELHRFAAMPDSAQLPPALRDRVMHAALTLPSGDVLMASDTIPGMGPPPVVGNTFSCSLHPTRKQDADRVFAALSEGGTVTMPLADQFWGAYFGMLVDRFGVQWMVNCENRA